MEEKVLHEHDELLIVKYDDQIQVTMPEYSWEILKRVLHKGATLLRSEIKNHAPKSDTENFVQKNNDFMFLAEHGLD